MTESAKRIQKVLDDTVGQSVLCSSESIIKRVNNLFSQIVADFATGDGNMSSAVLMAVIIRNSDLRCEILPNAAERDDFIEMSRLISERYYNMTTPNRAISRIDSELSNASGGGF